MHKIKLTDTIVQSLLISISIFCLVYNIFTWQAVTSLFAWQFLSITLHRVLRNKVYASRFRSDFLFVTVLLLLTLPIWLWFGYLVVLLWLPISVWYAVITWSESEIIAHKQLVHLK